MSASLDAIKALLRQQFVDEAERDAKLSERARIDAELAALNQAIERRSALIAQIEAQLTDLSSPALSADPPQPRRAPDPLSCRVLDYVHRHTPARHADLVLMIQSWTARDEAFARQKLSNLAEDRGAKARMSRKRAYLVSFWREGEKAYELSPYGRASLSLVGRVLAGLQKSGQNLAH